MCPFNISNNTIYYGNIWVYFSNDRKLKGKLQEYLIKFDKKSAIPQYEKDFELPEHDGLFEEYLEMGKRPN